MDILSRGKVRRLITRLVRNNRLGLRKSEKQYLNLGCGGNIRSEFLNMDYRWVPGLDICWDIAKGIPLPDNSMRGIVTEHALEHFTWKEALDVFLPECFRVLKPNGAIRVIVPCAEKAVDAYLLSRERGLTAIPFREGRGASHRVPLTPMTHLNNTFRRIFEGIHVGHKFVYDFQTLEYFLHLSGFVDIKRGCFMQGRDAVLLVDTERRKPESLYVEASKPR